MQIKRQLWLDTCQRWGVHGEQALLRCHTCCVGYQYLCTSHFWVLVVLHDDWHAANMYRAWRNRADVCLPKARLEAVNKYGDTALILAHKHGHQ